MVESRPVFRFILQGEPQVQVDASTPNQATSHRWPTKPVLFVARSGDLCLSTSRVVRWRGVSVRGVLLE